jgi:hypothetical protein
MKTIIHVNQHVIKANRKSGANDPVLTVKTYKDNRYGHEVLIKGDSRIVYSPDKPLSCGAHVWIETQGEVTVINDELMLEALGPCGK